jgi:hypothetical protein
VQGSREDESGLDLLDALLIDTYITHGLYEYEYEYKYKDARSFPSLALWLARLWLMYGLVGGGLVHMHTTRTRDKH